MFRRQTAWAQGRGGGRFGGGFGADLLGLLSQKSVQDELKLSDEQQKQATEADTKRGGLEGLRDLSQAERQAKFQERTAASEKTAAEILQPEQLKRLKQISLQQQGAFAYERPEVSSALQLTNSQMDQLKAIQADAREKMRGAFQGGQPDREKIQAARKAVAEQAAGVLTDEQKTKWKELVGEPFTGEIVPPAGGGNGGRRQRNN